MLLNTVVNGHGSDIKGEAAAVDKCQLTRVIYVMH